MFCKYCGEELDDNIKEVDSKNCICPFCAKNLNYDENNYNENNQFDEKIKNENQKELEILHNDKKNKIQELNEINEKINILLGNNQPINTNNYNKINNCNAINTNENHYNESKTSVGVLSALFLGVIGLFIGLLMYPTKSNSRSTFLTGWGATIIISFVIGLFVYILCLNSIN